jgi:hypothetical protein
MTAKRDQFALESARRFDTTILAPAERVLQRRRTGARHRFRTLIRRRVESGEKGRRNIMPIAREMPTGGNGPPAFTSMHSSRTPRIQRSGSSSAAL